MKSPGTPFGPVGGGGTSLAPHKVGLALPKEGSAPPNFLKIFEKLISFIRYTLGNLAMKILFG